MEQDDREREALRRRLYRPGASSADVASYLRVAEVEAPAPEPTEATPGPAARPFVIGAACVAAAALLGGLLLSGGLAATPTPTATPVAVAVATDGTDADGTTTFRVTFGPAPVLDGGARDHAHGVSVAEGPERYRYTVASGDTVAAIASRFQLCTSDVLVALPYGFDPGALPAGQTLELGRLAEDGGPDTC